MKEKTYVQLKNEYLICGYDPMNMLRYQDYMLCNHFVVLCQGEEQRMFQGPILLEMVPKTTNLVRAYYLSREAVAV